jgi:hypothetical protein
MFVRPSRPWHPSHIAGLEFVERSQLSEVGTIDADARGFTVS